MMKEFKIIVILFLISMSVNGQNQITCRLIDHETNMPVKDASISLLNKAIETTSNSKGYFQITADTSDYLSIEKPFYETCVVKVPFKNGIQIKMVKRNHCTYEGGMEQFLEYLKAKVKYPLKARKRGIQGRFFVSFTIDSLGQMENIKTLHDISEDCSLEVTQILKMAPNQWIPAEKITTFILPVTYRLGFSEIKIKDVELPSGILLDGIIIVGTPISK